MAKIKFKYVRHRLEVGTASIEVTNEAAAHYRDHPMALDDFAKTQEIEWELKPTTRFGEITSEVLVPVTPSTKS